MKKFFLLALLLIAVSSGPCLAAEADDIRVRAEVDKAFLTIGDPVTYTVTVEHSGDIQVLSDIPAPSSEFLEIKKVEDIPQYASRKKRETAYRRIVALCRKAIDNVEH